MRRTSSETGASSAIWNGGVFASFSSADLARQDLDLAGRELRVDGLGRAALHHARDADDELGAQPLGDGHQRVVFADDDLRDAGAIADVDEDHAAEVADAVHPAEQRRRSAPTSSGRSAPQVWVRVRSPSCSAIRKRVLGSGFQVQVVRFEVLGSTFSFALARQRPRPGPAPSMSARRCEVLHRDLAARPFVVAEDRHERRMPGRRVLELLAQVCPLPG